MQYTIDELRHKIFQRVYDVYEIFKNHFGEEFVDLQGVASDTELVNTIYASTDISEMETDLPIELSDADVLTIQSRYAARVPIILVWWPRVTITNEHNKFIIIQDLYAKIMLTMEGKIPYEYWGFKLTRSTYNYTQFQSGYCHSHVPGFYARNSSPDEVVKWLQPCLGTGPIKNTIMELKNSNNEVTWMLFCEELGRYVTVESLTGGPYRRLEEVGSAEVLRDYNCFTESYGNFGSFYDYDENTDFYMRLKLFTLYYLENGHLCLNYQNETFVPGMSYFDYMIDISNAFIDWFNQTGTQDQVQDLTDNGIIIHSFVADGKFYKSRRTERIDTSRFEGTPVLKFKGNDIKLHIEEEEEAELQTTTLLNHDIAMYILQNVLKIINYRYRNEHNNQQGAGNQTTAPAYQAVIYL